MAEALLMDTEAAVMANFAFLQQADVEMDDEDDMGDDMDLVAGNDVEMKQMKLKTKGVIVNDGNFFENLNPTVYEFIKIDNLFLFDTDDTDAEAEDVLNELNRLGEGEDSNMNERGPDGEWNQVGK